MWHFFKCTFTILRCKESFTMRSKHLHHIVRAAAFLLLFAVVFTMVNNVFSRPSNDYNHRMIAGFYEEPENTLDAVYIGSSNCFTFWNPVFAWKNYGIAVYHYACDDLPFAATAHLIEEVHKTQPDALILVNLNALHDNEIKQSFTHCLVDNMPMSANKIRLIRHLAKTAGWTESECMEFYFPIIKFHSRWNELQMNDFGFGGNSIKNVITYESFMTEADDISGAYLQSDEFAEPPEDILRNLLELLDYCDENQVRIQFVFVPRTETDIAVFRQFNTLKQITLDRGYPVLDTMDKLEDMGINLATDYYDGGHANIHGSMKFTRYLSEHLIESYGLTDKRGHEAYAGWDKAARKYADYIAPYALDIEYDNLPFRYTLSAPSGLTAQQQEDGSVRISWEADAAAEGYWVYRRIGTDSWQRIGEVSGSEFIDPQPGDASCAYRVVPFAAGENGQPCYGQFSYSGVRVQP